MSRLAGPVLARYASPGALGGREWFGAIDVVGMHYECQYFFGHPSWTVILLVASAHER